jgi:hypothetical protein
MRNAVIPGKPVSDVFKIVESNSTEIIKLQSSKGIVALRPFKSNRKRTSSPSHVLEFGGQLKANIYMSKTYKGYGYGYIKHTTDLIILDLKNDEAVEITKVPGGWLYYDVLLFDHINNKIKK